jgi:hypothetical protein
MGGGGVGHATAALHPGNRAGTYCTEGWVGRSGGLNGCGKFRPRGIRSLDRPARSGPLEHRMPKLHCRITQHIQQWFPKCSARGPLLV